jgi:apolipoprotein N-acyltransferase
MEDGTPGAGRASNSWFLWLGYPALSGLLLAAAMPPVPLGFLAWVGLIPLFLSAERLQGRSAFGAGFMHGVFFYALTIYWVGWITPVGTVAAILYLSVYKGFYVWAHSRIRSRFGSTALWCAPVLWTAVEYVNSLGDLGFPWGVLGLTQASYLPLIQYAEVTGIFGVSFWLVALNAILLVLIRGRVARSVAAPIAVILIFGSLGYGAWRLMETRQDPTVRVAAVQPNINPLDKGSEGFDFSFRQLRALSLPGVEEGAALVVWPETALPAYLSSEIHRSYRVRLHALADSLNAFLYTGSWRLQPGLDRAKTFNSSFLFAPGDTAAAVYDKNRLVPFGESAPFPELLPFLREITWSSGGWQSGNFDSGTEHTVFDGPGMAFSGMICYDSVFPAYVRGFALNGAECLVLITNDGWFGPTSGPYQHAAMSVFRAVENRRSLVRSANTGVSLLLDPYGRTLARAGFDDAATLVGDMPTRSDLTFYVRYGDLFSQACLVGLLGLLVAVRLKGAGSETDMTVRPAEGTVAASGERTVSGDTGDFDSMHFLDHLEELRWRILKGLGAVVVGALICAVFADEILHVLRRPIELMEHPPKLIYLKPMGMFIVKLNIALAGGAVIALPVLLYQLWLFVAPGLFSHERFYIEFIIVSSTLCFALGSAIAYYAVLPLAMIFLVGLSGDTGIEAQFDIGMYIGFVLRLLIAFGVVFELPVATFFLAKVGVVSAELMRSGRRYAYLGGFVLAALLTPPDPISQLMMAIPLILLYEISIWVARVAGTSPRTA